jgi:CO/xanthine dehydrogenase Mo-binding subunit
MLRAHAAGEPQGPVARRDGFTPGLGPDPSAAMSECVCRSPRRSRCTEYLRKAGAAAREMLVAAAAAQWDASIAECQTANSVVIHKPSGRTLRYGEIAEAAAKLPPPVAPKLEEPQNWTLLGTPQKRLDTADKVTGKPIFGIDVRVPNMLDVAITSISGRGRTRLKPARAARR